jgi:hypothetical protein
VNTAFTGFCVDHGVGSNRIVLSRPHVLPQHVYPVLGIIITCAVLVGA